MKNNDGAWMYAVIGGIDLDPDQPHSKHKDELYCARKMGLQFWMSRLVRTLFQASSISPHSLYT
jgi:hypothetical protein